MSRLNDCFSARDALYRQLVIPYTAARKRGEAPCFALRRVEDAVAAARHLVHAVGVGKKITAGNKTRYWCVRLYVTQKLPLGMLGEGVVLPKHLDGIPTDVVACNPAFLHAGEVCPANRLAVVRPLAPGVSISHFGVTTGTLGAFCRSTRTGDSADAFFVLSNNHVLADLNRALIGDKVMQPASDVGLLERDVIGRLDRFEGILDAPQLNLVDAAAARVEVEMPAENVICGIGKIQGTTEAKDAMPVSKYGATTGKTSGQIDDLGVKGAVGYDIQNPEDVFIFEDQIRIVPKDSATAFSKGGDSGSLVVDDSTKAAIGLLFAGPLSGDYSLANPISAVLHKLELELL